MYEMYHNLLINASVSKVFLAISEPNHLINWWPLTCTGKAGIGELYSLHFGPEYDWLGKVVKLEPDVSFHIQMVRSSPDWVSTRFGFDLDQLQHRTLVRFSHVGWQHGSDAFKTTSYCWAILLKGLKDYIEKEIVIPFGKRN